MTSKIHKFGTASIEVREAYGTLTIPIPARIEQRYGVASLNKAGVISSIRFHEDDFAFMDRVATELGISRSAFIRWCAVFAAQEVERKRTGTIVRVNP